MAGGAALLGALVVFAVALVPAVLCAKRSKAAWSAVGLGALAWCIGVALKVAWSYAADQTIHKAIRASLPELLADVTSATYAGLLTGIFECTVVWLVVRHSSLRNASWREALASGIGKGGVEAVMAGIAVSISALTLLGAFGEVDAETKMRLTSGLGPWTLVSRVFERALALVGHAASVVFIVYAVRVRQMAYFWVSFAYLSLVDALAVGALMAWGQMLTARPAFWLGLVLIKGIGFAGMYWLKPRFPSSVTT